MTDLSSLKPVATRESYGHALEELGRRHDNVVVLDADLSGSTRTGYFRKLFPERFVQCGIAEGNMMAAAAGLSSLGLVAYASSFAMFAAGRAFEQIRNSIGYPHLNVKICATHAGLSVGEDGASHQCCEDIALMRSIPGMVVINPSDDVEARAAVMASYEHEGPMYLRFGRLPVPIFHDEAHYHFEIGKGEVLVPGYDVTIIATGLMVKEAVDASALLAQKGISCRVINMATIKPLDQEICVQAAQETGHIITAEEHTIIGGLGEAVCSALAESCPVPVRRVGVMDKFGTSGPGRDVLNAYGLSASHLVEVAEDFLKKA